jgi:hypothetical protein
VKNEFFTQPPAYEDGTECSETSAHKIQTPGNNPEEYNKYFLLASYDSWLHWNSLLAVFNSKNPKGRYVVQMEEHYKNRVWAVDLSGLEKVLVEKIRK